MPNTLHYMNIIFRRENGDTIFEKTVNLPGTDEIEHQLRHIKRYYRTLPLVTNIPCPQFWPTATNTPCDQHWPSISNTPCPLHWPAASNVLHPQECPSNNMPCLQHWPTRANVFIPQDGLSASNPPCPHNWPSDSNVFNQQYGSSASNTPCPQDGSSASNTPCPQDGSSASNTPCPQDGPSASNTPCPQDGSSASNTLSPQDQPPASNRPCPIHWPVTSNGPCPKDWLILYYGLLFSIVQADLESMKLYLDTGVMLTDLGRRFSPALMCAAINFGTTAVKLLVEYGVMENFRGHFHLFVMCLLPTVPRGVFDVFASSGKGCLGELACFNIFSSDYFEELTRSHEAMDTFVPNKFQELQELVSQPPSLFTLSRQAVVRRLRPMPARRDQVRALGVPRLIQNELCDVDFMELVEPEFRSFLVYEVIERSWCYRGAGVAVSREKQI